MAVTSETRAIRPTHQHSLSSVSALSSASNEDLFASINGLDDFGADDDLCFDMDDEGRDDVKDLGASTGPDGKAKKGKRIGANTAEKKATHNAVERARRESLNVRFLVLADMLPGMVNVKRASKAAIVNKSIELINELRATETRLAKENENLKAEMETLRSQRMPPMPFGPMPMMGYHPAAQAHMFPGVNGMPMGMPGFPPMMPMIPPSALAMPQPQPAPENRPPSSQSSDGQSPAMQQVPQLPAFPAALNAMFGEYFSNAAANMTSDNVNNARSSSASPIANGFDGSLPYPAMAAPAFSSNIPFPSSSAGLDLNGLASGTSSQTGGSFLSRKDSLAFSTVSGSQTAPSPVSSTSSPASSHSVPTPSNTYSPIPLPSLGDSSGSTSANNVASPATTNTSVQNPAYAAFNASSDASYLAASFAPRDLAKAQAELQNFIQFQQSQAQAQAAQARMTAYPHSPLQANPSASASASVSAFNGFPMQMHMPKEESPAPFLNGQAQAPAAFDIQAFMAAAAAAPHWQQMMMAVGGNASGGNH